MKEGPCGYCRGVRLVGWSGAGPILCPRCCERDEDVFSVVTQAWREQRTRVVELEAELAALREACRWIPVGEDVPADCKDVLVWNGEPQQGWLDADSGWFKDPSGGKLYNVTHWRALPAPPEVQP